MLPYFPFYEKHESGMGARPYTAHDRLIEVDQRYADEVALKRSLLARDHAFYYRAQPDTLPAQWEVLALLLDDMARAQPAQFQLHKDGPRWTWTNALLGETAQFELGNPASLPSEPLDWVGRQVQEDLVLLSADESGRLVGGQLCFPSGWSLASRWEQALLDVHQRTPPSADNAVQAAHRLMFRLKPDRPVWRASWNFKLLNDLDLSDRERPRVKADFAQRAPQLTADTIGPQLWLRIERQSFAKLPESRLTLFLIHTYLSQLETEARDPQRAQLMLATLRDTPRDMMDYKAITPIEQPLLAYLERALQA